MTENTNDKSLYEDLERRIEIIENLDEEELGSFGTLDWTVLILFSLVIPLIAIVVAR